MKKKDIEYTHYNWIIGIPFLKKYRLSFDYEKKRIGFYKNDGKIINNNINKDKKEEKYNFFKSTIFKVILIVLFILIIFILGMLFQKYLQKPRKKKVNELDDNYIYEPYKDSINNNKNDFNKIGIESIN